MSAVLSSAPTYHPSSLTPWNQARTQLLTLFPDGFGRGEWLELRCLDCSVEPARLGPRHYFRSVTGLVDAAMKYRGQWDVFFGVGLRRCPTEVDIARCPHQKRGEDHVARLTAAWGDFDVVSADEPKKPYPTREAALRQLGSYEPPPDLLVGSGVGVHAYWLLGEATPDLQRVEAINRGIRAKLRGDNAIDSARILRVAGTFNHKHGRPLPVELLEARQ
jgi:hypothetical protein